MASEATVDYYAELGIHETASTQEIRAAYRQLALARHPDRNPNDTTATASFQRIQEAYEILGDPESKAMYDDARARTRQQEFPYEDRRRTEAEVRSFAEFVFHMFGVGSPFRFDHEARMQQEAWMRSEHERAEALWRAEQERAAAEQRAERERIAKERHEAAMREAAAVREKALADDRRRAERREAAAREAANRVATRDELARAERAQQEARWTLFKAVTDADKRSACLHSQYAVWPMAFGQRKAKCEQCGTKRSLNNFGCPYCGLLVCPKCRLQLAKQRQTLEENK